MKKVFVFLILMLTFQCFGESAMLSDLQKERVERINKVWNELRKDNLHILDNFYHPKTKFVDPVGSIETLNSLKKYYSGMYNNVTEIRFDFGDQMVVEDRHVATWVMTLKADGLNGGKAVVVEGISDMRFDPETNLVIYHRDYFDMGAMIYENIPVVGYIIKKIRSKFEH